MKATTLLLIGLATAAITGCNRTETERGAREAADDIRAAAATAGDRLADSWLTTKVQAQYFADDDVKARYIAVTSRDGVVTVKGQVESEDVRQQALQIAKNTDGVRQVQDQLAVVPSGTVATTWPAVEPGSAATSGNVVPTTPPASTAATIDDGRLVTMIQAKYFLDTSVKGREINVDAKNGIVTLRGRVASETERTQALSLARMTEGVQRVEDALTVDASLAQSTGTSGLLPNSAVSPGPATSAPALSTDTAIESRVKEALMADAGLKGTALEVSVKNGVVLIQGTVRDQASKQRALTIARQAEGTVQVVDRITSGSRR